MPYAVVQREITPPTAAQLENAFSATPGLTLQDARFILRHGLVGVLSEELDQPTAQALAAALTAAGAPAAAIDEDDLPEFPREVRAQHAGFTADALTLSTMMDQASVVPWDRVLLIAAADLPAHEASRDATAVLRTIYRGNVHMEPPAVTSAKPLPRHTLALICDGGQACYLIESQRFNYQCLGQRMTEHVETNFLLLAQELLRLAPRAVLNQGAALLAQESGPLMAYSSRHIFEREVVWLLWWTRQA